MRRFAASTMATVTPSAEVPDINPAIRSLVRAASRARSVTWTPPSSAKWSPSYVFCDPLPIVNPPPCIHTSTGLFSPGFAAVQTLR